MGDNSDTPTSMCGGQAGYPSQTHTQTIQTQANITHITNVYNFSNVGQVIHVPGDNNVTNVPNAAIVMHQQAMGVNPTVGQAHPPHPSHSHPSATSCDPTTGTAATLSSGVSVSQGATAMGPPWNQGFGTMQQNVTFADGMSTLSCVCACKILTKLMCLGNLEGLWDDILMPSLVNI